MSKKSKKKDASHSEAATGEAATGYQEPIGYPRKGVTLPPSEFGAAREKEVAESQPEAIAKKSKKEEGKSKK